MSDIKSKPRLAVHGQFAALALTWGSSFLFVKIALRTMTPYDVATSRMVLGAVTLIIIMAVLKRRMTLPPRLWLHVFVVSLTLCVVPFLLFAWAQQSIPSSVASIINATTPLMTLLVSILALPDERPGRRTVLGLCVGLFGVILVLGPSSMEFSGSLLAQLACLGATLSYGIGFVYLRRFVRPFAAPAISVATAQVGMGAVILLALSPLLANIAPELGALESSIPSPLGYAALLALGGLGTGLAYVWNTNIVSAWGATAGASVTYLAPAIGIGLGYCLLNERLDWTAPVGTAVIILGIVIANASPQRPLPDRAQRFVRTISPRAAVRAQR